MNEIALSFETAVGVIEPPSPLLTVRRSTSRLPLPQTNSQSMSAEHIFPLCRLFMEINFPVHGHCQIVCISRFPRIFLVSVFLLFGFPTPVNNSGLRGFAHSWNRESLPQTPPGPYKEHLCCFIMMSVYHRHIVNNVRSSHAVVTLFHNQVVIT